MARKLSYKLFGDPVFMKNRGIVLSGLFAWHEAFKRYGHKGMVDAGLAKSELEEYDLIHVNYTPGNNTYLEAIRKTLGESDTKIIANVDYSLILWNKTDPLELVHQLKCADFVFHVESNGAARVSDLLDKPVPTIPHPVDVDKIQELIEPAPIETPVWTCQYHRYLHSWQDYYYILEPLRKEYKFLTKLCNVTGNDALMGVVPLNAHFNMIEDFKPPEVYLSEVLGSARYNIDITYDYTYGRGVVEAAAMGIPTVGSTTIEAMHRCFPRLGCPAGHDKILRKDCKMLMEGGENIVEIATTAMERAKYYNLANSYDRLVSHLESAKVI